MTTKETENKKNKELDPGSNERNLREYNSETENEISQNKTSKEKDHVHADGDSCSCGM
jgi:hypothetical protein